MIMKKIKFAKHTVLRATWYVVCVLIIVSMMFSLVA